MKPPISLAASYATYLRRRYGRIARAVLADVVATWRTDSRYIAKAIDKLIRVSEKEAVPGAHIEGLGRAVSRKNRAGLKVAGVPTSRLAPEDAIKTFRDRNLALISSLDEDQVSRLRVILEGAEASAMRVETLRAKLIEEFEITKRHADLIARDQILKLNGQLTQARQEAVGVTQYEWSTSGDERVRPGHDELDGTIQSWSDPPVVDEKSDRRCHPGADYQCRCTAIPVL